MASNYLWNKQVFAIRKQKEKELFDSFPEMKNTNKQSGVYIWFRPIYKMYVGLAHNLLQRTIDHMTQHKGHLDNSIQHHKIYHPIKNKNGWKIITIPCPIEELNAKEQELIDKYKVDDSYELYNISGGGQGEERIGDIAERKESKKYRDGLKQGYENCLNEIKEYFDKYLSFGITPSNSTKKDGTIKEVYARKLKEFTELLERGNYGNEKDK